MRDLRRAPVADAVVTVTASGLVAEHPDGISSPEQARLGDELELWLLPAARVVGFVRDRRTGAPLRGAIVRLVPMQVCGRRRRMSRGGTDSLRCPPRT